MGGLLDLKHGLGGLQPPPSLTLAERRDVDVGKAR